MATTDSDDDPQRRSQRCPPWCADEHDPAEGGSVHRHVSRSVLVPGIALLPQRTIQRERLEGVSGSLGQLDAVIDLPSSERVAGVTVSIVMHHRDGSPLTWVYLGDGTTAGCEISCETAWLLVEALKELLGETVG